MTNSIPIAMSPIAATIVNVMLQPSCRRLMPLLRLEHRNIRTSAAR